MKKFVIAIDGPAASGKSTTARLTAKRLGYLYVDTGAMYRAMTLKVLVQGIDPRDAQGVARLAEHTLIELKQQGDECVVELDGNNVTEAIRSTAVTQAVSAVSAVPRVRELMVKEQQRLGNRGGVILEGRDIGTVVFPDADLKVFMLADPPTRARRRQQELAERSVVVSLDDLERELLERDRLDSERTLSPLRKADDAIVLDTSRLSIDEQVEFIIAKVEGLRHHNAHSHGR